MEFWQVVAKYPEYAILILFMGFSIISKKALYVTLAYIVMLTVKIISGKTTNFNVNVVATIGVTLSVSCNVVQFIENKRLKGLKGGK